MQTRLQELENVGCVHVEDPIVDANGRHWRVQFRSDIMPVSHLSTSMVKTTSHVSDQEPKNAFGAAVETATYIGATNHIGYTCPASSHGSKGIATLTYPWTSTHTGPWPLLVVQAQGTDASRVYTQRNESPGQSGGVCKGNNGCSYTASSLQSNAYYVFRVRAHNKDGWSEYSGSSDPVITVDTNTVDRGGTRPSRFATGMETHVSL